MKSRIYLIGAVAAAAFALAPAAAFAQGAGGVSDGGAFYVDHREYRTVGTPSDLSATGAPDHSFDTIYAIAEQKNVAEAKPGDRDFNGGRWRVHAIAFSDYDGALADPSVNVDMDGVLDSAEEVEAAIAGGYATDTGVVGSFECPVIPLPRGR